MTDTPDRRIASADTELASECVRIARLIDDQEAVLATKVEALAAASRWDTEDAWDWLHDRLDTEADQ